jgi:hypothetical protein
MLKRLLIDLVTLVALLAAVAPSAIADEALPKGAEGTFQLQGTNGYKVFGLIGSTGKARASGLLALSVSNRAGDATYIVRGEVTKEHVHFDLGLLGEIDVAVQPTGRMETVGSECGRSTRLEGEEYVGTIDFHGEEGFTEVEASRAPLRLEPFFDFVCAGTVGVGTTEGRGLPGVQIDVESNEGPRLKLDQNHPGAPVVYEAHLSEKEGEIHVMRTVTGRLGAGALRYGSSLDSASFDPAAPFSGSATYRGRRPWHEARPGEGTWRGDLKVDFPGHAGVRLAGPAFSASIVPARRTESHG